jgi:ABC-type siderophore export system fused ATPase/permease subunit
MKIRSAVVYSVLRLLAFLVPFVILIGFFPFFRQQYWLAGIFAALIGLSLSLLFLRRPLEDVTSSLAARRAADRATDTDEDIEDAAADAVAPAADAAAPDDERFSRG